MKLQKSNKLRYAVITALAVPALSMSLSNMAIASENKTEITFIHSGDFHGDYHPHTNGRGDAAGSLEGGMARAVTVINKIRDKEDNVIHVHTGDTIHGSGEASITKGMAMIRMVDQLGIDVSTPGNWEWAYTPYRYMQFFGVHDSDGNNMDIIADAAFDTNKYKAVRYKKGSKYAEDNVGDVPTFGESFKEVKYVASYNEDGTPNMAVGHNRWGMVAANAYENGYWRLDHGVASKGTGMNITPPYRIIEKDGVKIGFIGCTTNRGPQVVSSTITTGVSFSSCKGGIKFPQNRPIDWDDEAISHGSAGGQVTGNPATAGTMAGVRNTAAELADDAKAKAGEPTGWKNKPHWGGVYGYKVQNEIVKWTNHLRNVEGVDIVAVMSEAGIAENIYAAENLTNMDNGPDIYFSSDMHEESNYPVVVTDPNKKKVIIIENPEDIAQIGKLEIEVKNGKIVEWEYKGIDVDESFAEDSDMADMAAQIDQEISDKIAAGDASNPYNNNVINHQLNDVVGETNNIVVERNRFTTEWDPDNKIMPGVIEGTGHALITDVFRKFTGADVGGLRGFRYTNSVLDGDDITYKSMYHMFPIGAQIAVAAIPSTPASEKPTTKFEGAYIPAGLSAADYTVDAKGNIEYITYSDKAAQCTNDANQLKIDSNCNGVVLYDQADNKRHFVGFPRSLQQEMEFGMNSSHNPNIPAWGGGWSWNYSGITWGSQPSGPQFNKWGLKESARISNITHYDNADGKTDIDQSSGAKVSYASYYYHEDSNRINRNQIVTKGFCKKKGYAWPAEKTKCAAEKGGIKILTKTADGDYVMADGLEYDAGIASGELAVLDATEAMGRYISSESIEVSDWDGSARGGKGKKGAVLRTVAGLNGTFEGNDFDYPRAQLIKADGTPGNDLVDCTAEFGFPCIQPMRGAEAGLGIHTSLPSNFIKGTADKPALESDDD